MTTFGTSGNDFFAGNSGFDDYLALDGDDTIFGNEGGDNLNGNQNNDVVVGGPGNDTARGGQDNDQVFGNEGDDLLFGDRGSDTIVAGEGNDTVLGGNGINVTDADNENDLIFGNTGNDVLFGDRGADTIYGGQDNDTIYGGQENDEIFGDLGDDWLYGDKGSDSLTGGDGSDRFTLGNGIGGPTLDDADWFLDFVSGQDTLQLLGDLTFDQLNIFQGTGDFANHTIIQQNVTGEFLAILRDVDATTITGQPASPPAPPPPPAVTDPNTFPSVPPPPDVTPGDPPPVVPPPPPPPGSISLAPGVTPQEAGPVAGTFVLSRGGETTQALTVNYTVSGTATPGTDYTELSGTATFGVGESQAIIEVPTLDDTDVDGGETIEVTIAAPTGLTIAGDATQSLTILDNESSSISIAAGATPQEAEQVAGTFVLSRAGDASQALTVNYTVGGTATAGTDYTELSGTASFAAGSSQTVITVPTLDDTDVDPGETIEVTLTPPAGLAIDGDATQTLTILDNETPSIALEAATAPAEPATSATYTVTLSTAAPAGGVTIPYTVGGTASAADYTDPNAGTLTIAEGQTTGTIQLDVVDDTELDPNETLDVTLGTVDGYIISGSPTVSQTITDDEQPTVTIAPNVAGAESNPLFTATPVDGEFVLSRTGDLTNALTVNYTVGGNATAGTDYTDFGTSVTFAAGEAQATVAVPVLDDADIDPGETVTVTLAAGADYALGANSTATLNIIDDEIPEIGFDAANPVVSGEEAGAVASTFNLTRTGSADQLAAALTVNYTFGGTATAGTDYDNTGLGTATFAAGSDTATITVPTIDDLDVDPGETIDITLVAPAGYNIANNTPTATATIVDDDAPTVTIAATDANANENGDTGAFDITVVAGAGAFPAGGITVAYTVTGTATGGDDYDNTTAPIVATGTVNFGGAGATTFTVTPIDDAIGEGDETVIITLDAPTTASGYNLGAATTTTITIGDNDGTAGDDVLTGGAVAGVLAGGDGNDNITAGTAGDVLVGGNGNDVLTGGAAADSFRYNATTEGTDTINNFTVGTDKISVATGAFGGLAIGSNPAAGTQFISGAGTVAADGAGAPQFIYNTTTGELRYDADGAAGGEVLLATLNGTPALANTDIEYV
jgi:hypothetical protein